MIAFMSFLLLPVPAAQLSRLVSLAPDCLNACFLSMLPSHSVTINNSTDCACNVWRQTANVFAEGSVTWETLNWLNPE